MQGDPCFVNVDSGMCSLGFIPAGKQLHSLIRETALTLPGI